jgi:hypothetical protein
MNILSLEFEWYSENRRIEREWNIKEALRFKTIKRQLVLHISSSFFLLDFNIK